jgi:hypothetical protein
LPSFFADANILTLTSSISSNQPSNAEEVASACPYIKAVDEAASANKENVELHPSQKNGTTLLIAITKGPEETKLGLGLEDTTIPLKSLYSLMTAFFWVNYSKVRLFCVSMEIITVRFRRGSICSRKCKAK